MSVKSNKASGKSLRRRLTSLADCDIVKKGTLHIKRPPKNMKIRLKTWQSRFFVLRDDSYDRGCRLEIYPNENNWNECRQSDRIIIDLRQVTHIEEYRQSRSFPFSFVITRRGESPLILGTLGEAELREWIVAVQLLVCKTLSGNGKEYYQDNTLTNSLSMTLSGNDPLTLMALRNNVLNSANDPAIYRSPVTTTKRPQSVHSTTFQSHGKENLKWGYWVDLRPSAAAQRNRLSGEYRIQVAGNCILLRKIDSNLEVVRWGLVHIRKLKSEEIPGDSHNEMLTLEANVHSGIREGIYQFKTPYARHIIGKVRDSVKQMSIRSPPSLSSPLTSLSRPGLCHKSESDPCLERRRFHSSSSTSSSRQQLSRDWLDDDCPPRQRAPVPASNDSPTGWSHSSRTSSTSGSPASSDREQDDELPPPYLEVLAAEDDLEQEVSSSGSSDSEDEDHDYSVFESVAPTRPNVTRGDSGFSEMTDDVRQVQASGSMMTYRRALDSCPDEPPPPPPRPKHTFHSHVNYMNSRNFSTSEPSPDTSQQAVQCPPPLPPRDF